MRFGVRLGTVFGPLTKQGMARARCRKGGGAVVGHRTKQGMVQIRCRTGSKNGRLRYLIDRSLKSRQKPSKIRTKARTRTVFERPKQRRAQENDAN